MMVRHLRPLRAFKCKWIFSLSWSSKSVATLNVKEDVVVVVVVVGFILISYEFYIDSYVIIKYNFSFKTLSLFFNGQRDNDMHVEPRVVFKDFGANGQVGRQGKAGVLHQLLHFEKHGVYFGV